MAAYIHPFGVSTLPPIPRRESEVDLEGYLARAKAVIEGSGD